MLFPLGADQNLSRPQPIFGKTYLGELAGWLHVSFGLRSTQVIDPRLTSVCCLASYSVFIILQFRNRIHHGIAVCVVFVCTYCDWFAIPVGDVTTQISKDRESDLQEFLFANF